MSELLKGNFEVKHKPVVADSDPADFKDEFKKKALESIGGSMVFVERELLFWDESNLTGDE